MMLEGEVQGRWRDPDRPSRLVFIGRNLPREHLRAGFETCLATQPTEE
jgi:G3E family GTPase